MSFLPIIFRDVRKGISPSADVAPQTFSFHVLGAPWSVTIWKQTENDDDEKKEAIIAYASTFEQTYSRFLNTSFLSSLGRHTGIVETPPDCIRMLRIYQKLYSLSEKKFTPLIGSVLHDLGYDSEYSFIPHGTVHQPPDFEEAIEILDDQTLNIRQPVSFDFGGLGKGYLIDALSAYLRIKGCAKFLVDGSGDLLYEGNGSDIRIGLQHPDDSQKAIGVATIFSGSLCGSGSDKRAWGGYHHIIDPLSLKSPSDICATWVMAETALIADALATCLFFADPKNFEKDFSFEYCMIDHARHMYHSTGFPAEFF